MTDIRKFNLDITLNGETRTVEFTAFSDKWASSSAAVALGKIGYGGKNHAVEITAWRLDKMDPRTAATYSPKNCVTDADGVVWGIGQTGYALNRQARIIGWFDDTSKWNSQHIGSARRSEGGAK